MNKLAKCITYVTQDPKRCQMTQISNLWNIAMVLSSILGVPHLGFQFLNCSESQPFSVVSFFC